MRIVREPIPSREVWFQMRRRDVTASESAALFGRHKYVSMLGLFVDKLGLVPFEPENDVQRRGRHMEGAILSAATEEPEFEGRTIHKADFYIRAPAHRIGATLDATVDGREPLDAKSVAPWVFEQEWAEGPPLHIQLQVLQQAMLMDAPRAWVACVVMSPDWPIHIFEVPRHPEMEAQILRRTAAFWKLVENRTPPDPNASDHKAIGHLYPEPKVDEMLDLNDDDEFAAWVDERVALDEMMKPMVARKSALDANIKFRIGEHKGARAPGYRITLGLTKKKEYLVKATSYRSLRVYSETPDGDLIPNE